jgi:hypothetical protein
VAQEGGVNFKTIGFSMKTLTMPAATGTQNENGGHFQIKLHISGMMRRGETSIPPNNDEPAAPIGASCAADQ